jgi:hypothetical protein
VFALQTLPDGILILFACVSLCGCEGASTENACPCKFAESVLGSIEMAQHRRVPQVTFNNQSETWMPFSGEEMAEALQRMYPDATSIVVHRSDIIGTNKAVLNINVTSSRGRRPRGLVVQMQPARRGEIKASDDRHWWQPRP